MVFAILLGSRGSLRKARKIRAFGPPKSTLGPVFASQKTIKSLSFVGHEAEKRRLLPCFSTRKVPFFFVFRLENARVLLVFRGSLRLSRKWRILRIFGASPRLSRRARFWRKAIFRESPVFYWISTFDPFWGPHFLGFWHFQIILDDKNNFHLNRFFYKHYSWITKFY